MSFALSRQLFLFLLIGGCQVLLDWAVFVALTHAGLPLVASNLVGRLCGAMLGFQLNGRYTFANESRARLNGQHFRRFLVAWLLITTLSTLSLWMVLHRFDMQAAWLAKPAVEAVMAVIGFVVWRQWVFR